MATRVLSLAQKQLASGQGYLGPAEVLATGRRLLDVKLPAGETEEAELALAYPYKPAVGDTLLVISNGGRLYVIGVIEGQGQLDLAFHGDVHLQSVDGELTLSGQKGVKLHGPAVELVTESLSILAGKAVQKFTTLNQRVREILTLRARESHTIVDETSLQRAKKHAVVAEETASVNGKQILLG